MEVTDITLPAEILSGKRGVRALCIDGGGGRGVIPIEILHNIQLRTKKPIWDLFDVICGTSTGGIISLALVAAHLNLKADPNDDSKKSLEALYKSMGADIFNKSKLTKATNWVTKGSLYSSEELTQAIKSVVGETKLKDIKSPLVFVTATEQVINTPTACLFKNYTSEPQSRYMEINHCSVWEAALATSAAPGYFPSIKVADRKFIDGGLGHNNSTEILLGELQALWEKEKPLGASHEIPIDCIVSIGTGIPVVATGSSGFKDIFDRLTAAATESERVHNRVNENTRFNGKYFRFNPGNGTGSMPLDMYKLEDFNALMVTAVQFTKEKPTREQLENLTQILLNVKTVQPAPSHSFSPDPMTTLIDEYGEVADYIRQLFDIKAKYLEQLGTLGYAVVFKKTVAKEDVHYLEDYSKMEQCRQKLKTFWNKVIELYKKKSIPDVFDPSKDWLTYGRTFTLVCEPLDIANYYGLKLDQEVHKASGYKEYNEWDNRPERYQIIEQHWEECHKPHKLIDVAAIISHIKSN